MQGMEKVGRNLAIGSGCVAGACGYADSAAQVVVKSTGTSDMIMANIGVITGVVGVVLGLLIQLAFACLRYRDEHKLTMAKLAALEKTGADDGNP